MDAKENNPLEGKYFIKVSRQLTDSREDEGHTQERHSLSLLDVSASILSPTD